MAKERRRRRGKGRERESHNLLKNLSKPRKREEKKEEASRMRLGCEAVLGKAVGR